MGNNGLSDSQLKIGYWILLNKKKWFRWFIRLFIGFNVILWGYNFYGWTDWFMGREAYLQLLNDLQESLVNVEAYKQKETPQGFQTLGLFVFSLGENRYDLVGKLRNPNPQWMALIEYQFVTSNPKLKTKVYKDFILPSDEKYLIDSAVESESTVANPKINLISLKWERVRGFEEKKKEMLRFDLSDIEFQGSKSLGIGDKVEISRVNFKAFNRSPYNFSKVGFAVVLLSGPRPVGVNYLIASDFLSEQIKNLEVNWFSTLPGVTKVEVKPDVNILDKSNYKGFKGVVMPDIRDYGAFRRLW